MSATGHFTRVSEALSRLWNDDFLHDFVIITDDGSVSLHSFMMMIFSSYFREKGRDDRNTEYTIRGFKRTKIGQLVKFLYNGEEKVPGNFQDIIIALKLDLIVDQNIKKKTLSTSDMTHNLIEAELKYLRNLTLEMMIPKLLENQCNGWDLSLRTGKEVHKCHKILLCANSTYFKLMFSSGMRESEGEAIYLHGIQTDIFRSILTYMYSGQITITTKNAQDLLSTAVYLQIPELQALCEEFLLQHVDVQNCVEIWLLAELYNCQTLLDGAWSFMVDNFCSIPKYRIYYNLKPAILTKLLSDNNLNVSDETDVIKVILDFIRANTSLSDNEIRILLDTCRLSLIDEKYLTELLQNNKLLLEKRNVHTILTEVITKQRNLYKEQIPRKEKTFVVIKRSSYTTGIEAACYSLSSKTWYSLKTNTLCAGGTGFVCCSVKDSIIVSGGTATPKYVTQYLVNENRWQKLAEMNEGRSSHAIGHVEDRLYVLGGSDTSTGSFNILSSIEKYSFQENRWTKVGKIEIPTYDSAFAVVRSRIYIFGGSMGMISGVYTKDIQCFDTVTETCTKIYHNLPTTLSLADACVNNRNIYITCPNGSMMHYDEEKTPVKINKTHGSQLMGYSTLYHDNAVYIMGGYSVHGESDAIQKFDLKSKKEVKLSTKLPFMKQTNQLFATTMYISRRFLTSIYPRVNAKGKSQVSPR